MTSALNDHSLDQIFRSARTPNGWADRPVEDDLVRQIYDLLKWGPTSANKPKILKAPVTVIIGHDLDFAGWFLRDWRSSGTWCQNKLDGGFRP